MLRFSSSSACEKVFEARREVNDCEQQVADFFLEMFAALRHHRVFYFAHFLFDLRDDVLDVLPVKTDAGDLALHLVGFQEAWANVSEDPPDVHDARGAFLGLLDRLPLLEDLGSAVAGFGRAEHVRMAADELVVNGFCYRIEKSNLPSSLAIWEWKTTWEEKIAEFILEGVRIPRVQGVDRFVAFLDEVMADGLVRLLAVPWTAARGREGALHDLEKPGRCSWFASACLVVRTRQK